jgi:hypothetical protein
MTKNSEPNETPRISSSTCQSTLNNFTKHSLSSFTLLNQLIALVMWFYMKFDIYNIL